MTVLRITLRERLGNSNERRWERVDGLMADVLAAD